LSYEHQYSLQEELFHPCQEALSLQVRLSGA